MKTEDRYDSLIRYYSARYERNPLQIKRQIRMESAFKPLARNARSGAMGLMQFMPATWKEWEDGTPGVQPLPKGGKRDPFNPEDSILAGCSYGQWLERFLWKRTQDLVVDRDALVLAGYNWGPGNVLTCTGRHGPNWLHHLPLETRGYVRRGLLYREEVIV